MKNKEIVKVVQAHIDGKTIQYKSKNPDSEWRDCVVVPSWDFLYLNYRIKPKPRRFLLYGNTQDNFYGYEITHKDDAEIERLKSPWKYTIEVAEDVFYEE